MNNDIAQSAGDDRSIETDAITADEINELDYQNTNIGIEKYEKEHKQFGAGIEEVRRRAVTGALRTSRLRSLAWAILLETVSPDSNKWLEQIKRNRQQYDDLKKSLSCDPRCCKHPEDNPLSQTDESIWNQHFRDTELQTVIKLDVVRTFPGIEFFKQPEIQEAMVNVLFCFARETPTLVYRQGMHEILAPLLFVLQCDHRAAEHTSLGEELTEIMDPDYLEHDSYMLFKKIMSGIESFYRISDLPPDIRTCTTQNTNSNLHVKPMIRRSENDVVRHLAIIRETLLIPQDPELAEHLQKCDISLSLFGIRWLRVLFGREFPLHDLLVLWDAILAEGNDFSLTGYIMVAMLIAIRTPLLNSDAMVCLTHVMHYPTTIDVQYIIDHALYLKHPKLYCMPAASPFCYTTQINQSIPQPSKQPRKITKAKPKATTLKVADKENMSGIKVAGAANDSGIIDGYTLEEPELLRDELSHAHNVMSLCRLKLEQYEEVLHGALPETLPPSHPAFQALGGIRELCTLLKSRYDIPSDIEPAFEANEVGSLNSKSPVPTQLKKTKEMSKIPVEKPNAVNVSKKMFAANKPNSIFLPNTKEVPLKVFNHIVNSSSVQTEGIPNHDPLGIRTD